VAEGVEICYIDKSVMSHVLVYAYVGITTPKNVMEEHVLICREIEVVSDIPSFSLISYFNSCNKIICRLTRFRSVGKDKA
jgi:hypothetical protein